MIIVDYSSSYQKSMHFLGNVTKMRANLRIQIHYSLYIIHYKQLPNMISNRLSNLSCSPDIFMSEKPLYQTALNSAGYIEELKYIDSENMKKKRNRKRKIVWFNPPYNKNVKTNIRAKFLSIIDKHFKNTNLGKYFNRRTL